MGHTPPPERSRLDDAGWTTIPDLLSSSEVAAVLTRCQSLLTAPAQDRRAGDKPDSGTRHLDELDTRIDLVAEVLGRRALRDPVCELVGSEAHLVQAHFRCPQPGFGGQRLHADDPPKLDDGPALVATAMVALTAFTEASGATRVVPGSHRRVDLQRVAGQLERHDRERLLTGAAGTAFVFSGHLLHSGTTNRGTHERPALQFVWRR